MHRRNPFDWEQLREALSSVTGALMHGHAYDFVHRDVSPVNVMRLGNGHWVLSDYGLVKASGFDEIKTSPTAKFGTPWFSAPEVHLNPASAAAADAWSVGALASWFTGIGVVAGDGSQLAALFSPLIDGTVDIDPASRWTMDDIAAYLNTGPLTPVQVPVLAATAIPDRCVRCGAQAGHDASCRCLGCGFIDFD